MVYQKLISRNETLLKVASSIVQHQRAFLDHGDEAMRPLILADIAGEVDLHESTVSRATTRKYMHTPRGIYELKYFFQAMSQRLRAESAHRPQSKRSSNELSVARTPKSP